VVESGPFTTLEQAMLPETVAATERTRAFGVYNAVATVAGSLGRWPPAARRCCARRGWARPATSGCCWCWSWPAWPAWRWPGRCRRRSS
jgi:hypothetical protein